MTRPGATHHSAWQIQTETVASLLHACLIVHILVAVSFVTGTPCTSSNPCMASRKPSGARQTSARSGLKDSSTVEEDATWQYGKSTYEVWHKAYKELKQKDDRKTKNDAYSRYLLDKYFPAKLEKYKSRSRRSEKESDIAGPAGAGAVFQGSQAVSHLTCSIISLRCCHVYMFHFNILRNLR